MVPTVVRGCAVMLLGLWWHTLADGAAVARPPRLQTEAPQTLIDRWRGVKLLDPQAAMVLRHALEEASRRLARPQCRTLLTDFRDRHGRSLVERLAAIGPSVDVYLGWIQFYDNNDPRRCERAVVAYTEPGSRVVRVCSFSLERTGRRNFDHLVATVIHELLHTLGLGENPPSSEEITARVRQRCWNDGRR